MEMYYAYTLEGEIELAAKNLEAAIREASMLDTESRLVDIHETATDKLVACDIDVHTARWGDDRLGTPQRGFHGSSLTFRRHGRILSPCSPKGRPEGTGRSPEARKPREKARWIGRGQ